MNQDISTKITPILKDMPADYSEAFILKVFRLASFEEIAERKNITVEHSIFCFRCALLYIAHVLHTDTAAIDELMNDPEIMTAHHEFAHIYKKKIDVAGLGEKLNEIAEKANAAPPENKREANIQCIQETSELMLAGLAKFEEVMRPFFNDRRKEEEFAALLDQTRLHS